MFADPSSLTSAPSYCYGGEDDDIIAHVLHLINEFQGAFFDQKDSTLPQIAGVTKYDFTVNRAHLFLVIHKSRATPRKNRLDTGWKNCISTIETYSDLKHWTTFHTFAAHISDFGDCVQSHNDACTQNAWIYMTILTTIACSFYYLLQLIIKDSVNHQP